jgi:hypothetical protein
MNVPQFPWPAPLSDMISQAVARLVILDDSTTRQPTITH